MNTLHIRPKTSKPGTSLFAFSLVLLACLAAVAFMLPGANLPVIAILIAFAIVLLIVAVKLLRQPHISFTLTFMHLQFHSSAGGWLVQWRNVSQIGQVSVAYQGWHTPLPWVGVQVKDYGDFLRDICPRVASQLLIEQRGLLVLAYKRAESPSHAIEDMLFDDTPYVATDGTRFNGLSAMLANRMRYNRELLGFDFFIPEELLDRPVEDFIGLARRYLAEAQGV